MPMKIIPLFLLSAALGLVSAGSASAADVTAPGNLQVIALMVVAPDGGKDNRFDPIQLAIWITAHQM